MTALGFVLGAVSFAAAQQYPQTLPPNTVVGRLGAGQAGPAQAIPFSAFAANAGAAPAQVMSCPNNSPIPFQFFANIASAPTGTTLNIYDGMQCLPFAIVNATAHTIGADFNGPSFFTGNNANPTTTGAFVTINTSSNTLAANENYNALQVTAFAGPSTTISNVNTIAAYVRSQVAGPNPAAVGFYAIATAETAGANAFGANFSANDFYASTISTNATIHILEGDLNIESTSTVASGITLAGFATVQPALAEGFYVNCLSCNSPGTALWSDGFRTDDYAATNFALIGTAGAAGANVGSQPIVWRTYNGSGLLATFTQKAYVASGVASFDLTSQYSNFNVGIGTSAPIDNTGAGYTGLTLTGTVGAVFSLAEGGTEDARIIGTNGAFTLAAQNNSTLAIQTGGSTREQITSAGALSFLVSSITVNSNAALSCSGTPTSSFATTDGIVTHC